jgi:hypothetical protein
VPPSLNTCQTSSQVLAHILRAAGVSARTAQGNRPGHPEGFWHQRNWHGHAWVHVGNWIVDITADQFGLSPVLIVPETDPRFKEGLDSADPTSKTAREVRAQIALREWASRANP